MILDARAPAIFEQGHLQDGQNMFFKNFQNADGTIKTPEEIKAIMGAANLDISKNIITQCQAGNSATYLYAALTHAGVPNLRVYDGSYSEYVSISSNVLYFLVS